jgi:hypothetical protein
MARPDRLNGMRSSKALAATLLTLTMLAAACSDDTAVDAGGGTTTTTSGGGSDEAPDGSSVTVPDRTPDLTGTITAITPFVPITENCIPAEDLPPDGSVSSDDPRICSPEDSNVIGTVLVEGDLAPEAGRKISYTVTTDTKLTGRTSDGLKVGVFAGLAAGQTVDTWATGACAESYPEQCTAEAIRVVG